MFVSQYQFTAVLQLMYVSVNLAALTPKARIYGLFCILRDDFSAAKEVICLDPLHSGGDCFLMLAHFGGLFYLLMIVPSCAHINHRRMAFLVQWFADV